MTHDMLSSIQNLIGPILVTILGMLVLLMDIGAGSEGRRRYLPLLSIVGLIGAAVLSGVNGLGLVMTSADTGVETYFGGGMVSDHIGSGFSIVMCLAAMFAIGMSGRYLEEKHLNHGEFYALILFSAAGGMFMALSYDLVNVFVGLEVLSVALYILAGFARRERRSEEAAVKYFLLGAFASGFLLYGTALIYGAVGLSITQHAIPVTGSSYTNFYIIGQALRESAHTAAPLAASPIFVTGVALLLVGLGFKAAIVPFHSYAPDVYEGAPTPVTAFMSVGAKVGAFAALLRFAHVLHNGGSDGSEPFRYVVWILAIATMVVGNVLAVRQTNMKRMLAYSSIAHAGYLLVGILASAVPPGALQNINASRPWEDANQAVLFYLFVYALMNLGAFALVVWLGRVGGGEYTDIRDYAGLARRHPWAAAMMSVFMLSLAGIPPAAGFLGKLYLFMSAVKAGYPELAVIGLVVSAIGVFYYLNIIMTMYFRDPIQEFDAPAAGGDRIVAGLCALGTLAFGLFPIPVISPTPPTNEQPPLVEAPPGQRQAVQETGPTGPGQAARVAAPNPSAPSPTPASTPGDRAAPVSPP